MNEDVEFLDKFAKKREDFFKQMKPDEEFLAQKEHRHREKQREFFRETMSGKTTPPNTKTSTGNIGISMAKVDDHTVSAVVNSLKQKGIEVSPENISQMIAQHSNQNYTLEQIAAIVEVDCERQHAREQAKKQERYNGLSM